MRTFVMDAVFFGWEIVKLMLAVTAAWLAAERCTGKKKRKSVYISV